MKKSKSLTLVLLIIVLFSTPNGINAEAIGSYTFSTEVVYVGGIQAIGVLLYTTPFDNLLQVYLVEDHTPTFTTITFDDTYSIFNTIAAGLTEDQNWIQFKLGVSQIEGGSDIVDEISIDNNDFILNKEFTITSIVLDPSGLKLWIDRFL